MWLVRELGKIVIFLDHWWGWLCLDKLIFLLLCRPSSTLKLLLWLNVKIWGANILISVKLVVLHLDSRPVS